ncbi:MAG TPA: hypothetical protein VNW15_10050 [Rhizomicrobium sp.]|jgi:hypothetical protein|nr:hypothetical protein [Rhizomicrobium sp.]
MTPLQFISSIVGSIAWPTTIILIILILRKQILALIPSISSLKYGDFEAKFENRLERAESDLLSLPPVEREVTSRQVYTTDSTIKFQRSATVHLPPHLEITESWRSVERELRSVAEQKGLGIASTAATLQLIRVLANKEYINPILFRLLNELRSLRNFAAHSTKVDQISLEQAQRYSETAEQVVQQLKALR